VKILLSWLREFVDVPGTAEEVARTMSVRGFAVEGIERDGEDAVIDFEITANRPDCMSVLGMAREVATAYDLQTRRPAVGDSTLPLVSLKTVDKADVEIIIDAPNLCPRYAGAVADVQVGPSPAWIQARLQAAGVRPISNIVDLTNYVLLELGQPMHAFDLSKLTGAQIRVRPAAAGEALHTLDGQMRTLSPDMLVIADTERPVAVAGVMGGAESEVTNATSTIVLESAYFDALSVRRTSRKLGLKTEASIRFERGADPRMPVTAMERACALLQMIGAGTARGTVVDGYPTRVESRTVSLRRARIQGLLGVAIPDAEVKRILEQLGFALKSTSEGWDITVPTRRVDVRREVDLIEEVARHYGFDRVPVTFPALTSPAPLPDPRIQQTRGLRTLLTASGFSEAVTFGFVGEGAALAFAPQEELVPIANPLSENFAVLRPSVLPGLIAAVAHNRRREQRDIRLFEVGGRFSRTAGERRAVACAWTGAGSPAHWSGEGREVDFFDIKGTVERICEALRVEISTVSQRTPWLVPGCAASAVAGDSTFVGVFGQLAPAVLESMGLPPGESVYVAEIDLDAAEAAATSSDLHVEPLPRYPSVTRDVSILIANTVAAGDVRRTIQEAAPAALVRIREFDRYQGKGVPEGKISLSLRLTFRSPDRTLTDAEVQSAMDAILAALQHDHDAIQR